jgi:hypothetical protein
MWQKLEEPVVFFRKPNGGHRTEAMMSFGDEAGNFCHLALEDGKVSLWRGAEYRYERMVEWPREILTAFVDCRLDTVMYDARRELGGMEIELKHLQDGKKERTAGNKPAQPDKYESHKPKKVKNAKH